MNYTNDNVKKICNFYMSDWHFTVMLLPYINKEINKGTKVITIFEKDMSEKVQILVEKLNLKNKDKILQINWKNININNFMNYIEVNLKKEKQNLLIINGNNDYINKANSEINEFLKDINCLEKEVRIVNCYDFNINKDNMYNILKRHDAVLNTSGESKIENVL